MRQNQILTSNKELAIKLERLEHKIDSNDQAIVGILQAIRELMKPPELPKKRPIGFVHQKDDKED